MNTKSYLILAPVNGLLLLLLLGSILRRAMVGLAASDSEQQREYLWKSAFEVERSAAEQNAQYMQWQNEKGWRQQGNGCFVEMERGCTQCGACFQGVARSETTKNV
jgi:hypothetical protein